MMNRRSFLAKSGMGMLAVTLIGKNTYAFSRLLAPPESCIPTTADILGPYYRSGAPFRTDLTIPGDPGTLLNFKGQVTGPDCNPIVNAIVDVWQAADDASYDGSSPQFKYRGRQYTGSNGDYFFNSIKPGWYLNGAQYRPSHIHFRVTANGFTELITQLYFEGDPYIAADPWASDPDADLRIVPVAPENGVDTAVFNITLGSTMGIDDSSVISPVQIVNPFNETISFTSESVLMQNIELFNAAGILLASAYNMSVKTYHMSADAFSAGTYFCRVQTSEGIYVHKLLKSV